LSKLRGLSEKDEEFEHMVDHLSINRIVQKR